MEKKLTGFKFSEEIREWLSLYAFSKDVKMSNVIRSWIKKKQKEDSLENIKYKVIGKFTDEFESIYMKGKYEDDDNLVNNFIEDKIGELETKTSDLSKETIEDIVDELRGRCENVVKEEI